MATLFGLVAFQIMQFGAKTKKPTNICDNGALHGRRFSRTLRTQHLTGTSRLPDSDMR